jgi:hypothetical protein
MGRIGRHQIWRDGELTGQKIGHLDILQNQLIAGAKIKHRIVSNLLESSKHRLRCIEMERLRYIEMGSESDQIDPVRRSKIRDCVDTIASRDQELVGSRTAVENITSTAAKKHVVAITTEQSVVPVFSHENVISGFAEEPIIALSAIDCVVAITTEYIIVSAPSGKYVVCGKAENALAIIGAVQRVRGIVSK